MIRDIEIIGIFSRNNELGEGKTLLLTNGMVKKHKKFPDERIYSDYKLPFSEDINHVSELPDIYNSSICLDDVTAFFDCRDSGKGNFNETWFLFQLRKNQNHFYYDAQISGSVESRLRKISNLIFETQKIYLNPKTLDNLFHIWKYDKNITLIDDYDIKYSKELLQMYNTLEKVKREVSLKRLIEYLSRFKSKVSFRQITKAQFSFKNATADTVYDCLKVEDSDSIKKILIPYGYELTE